ncbi:hypothetical protein LPJ73_007972 [Coemansia sp. RSA 2703]|nr:hypothetical protein LPJ73_007972 [Coemansia sp. RSA 2703]
MARESAGEATEPTKIVANTHSHHPVDTAGTTRSPSATHVSDVPIPSIVLRSATEPDAGSSSALLSRPHGLGIADDDDDEQQEISLAEQRKGIVMVLVGRFVFVPTLAIALISTLRICFPHWLPIMVNDPVYILTLLILSGTPPAINLITVSQATGKFETEAAQILFYGYILGIFVLAIEVSGFLWLTSALSQI